LKILEGKKDKLRPGESGFKGDAVRKISVLERMSYIAIEKERFYAIQL